MAAITAAMVNELRQKTGAGMMQCKKALTEADGNIEEAVTVLRKTLGDKAAKRGAERAASEGLVLARVSDNKQIGAIIELNSETDFVARNEDFKALGKSLVARITEFAAGTVPTDLEGLLAAPMGEGTVGSTITDAAGRIGEKVALSRFERFGAPEGNAVASYVHNPGGSGDEGGKIGVLVEVTGGDKDELATLAREIALHVSSSNPAFLSEDEVSAELIEKEREIAKAQALNDPKMAGKPEGAINAMVNGRIRVFLEESVLLKQSYIRDPAITIADLVKKTAGASVVRFVRFRVGETQADAAETEEGAAA